ncbi:MAG: NAD(P)H-hydrate dehydratase [Nitrososphaeraceae archaeon]
MLPASLIASRKGDNGIVLVVGGSGIYHGAPLLSTLSALRSEVDLVYTAIPKSNVAALRSFSPNIIALPFPNDEFTIGSAKHLLKILPQKARCCRYRNGHEHNKASLSDIPHKRIEKNWIKVNFRCFCSYTRNS